MISKLVQFDLIALLTLIIVIGVLGGICGSTNTNQYFQLDCLVLHSFLIKLYLRKKKDVDPMFIFAGGAVLLLTLTSPIQVMNFDDTSDLDGSWGNLLGQEGLIGGRITAMLFTVTSVSMIALQIRGLTNFFLFVKKT